MRLTTERKDARIYFDDGYPVDPRNRLEDAVRLEDDLRTIGESVSYLVKCGFTDDEAFAYIACLPCEVI